MPYVRIRTYILHELHSFMMSSGAVMDWNTNMFWFGVVVALELYSKRQNSHDTRKLVYTERPLAEHNLSRGCNIAFVLG